jgi:hypothetical protein
MRKVQEPATVETKRGHTVNVSKPTQTHLKAAGRFYDLMLDGQFMDTYWNVRLADDPEKRNTLLQELAERYSLDAYPGSPLWQLITSGVASADDADVGFCHIVDEATEVLDRGSSCFLTPPALSWEQQHRLKLYPVHITVSPLATKREVIDYVAKRWPEIRGLLDTHRKKEPRVRKRPQGLRDEFIWENRILPCKQLADMVNAKFSGESQTYSTVQAIVQLMRAQPEH